MWAIIPVKNLTGAKQRLSAALNPQERYDLYHAMLTDVLFALADTPNLNGIALITRDTEVKQLAAKFGAETITEAENNGQTSAVHRGIVELMARGVKSILQVPGDVPLATAVEFSQVIAAHLPAPAMTIVPARDQQGSNCIVCSPPNSVALRFGDNSFFPHLEAARQVNIEPTVVPLPGLGLDIDSPADLKVLIGQPAETLSQTYLAESGIAARLQQEQKSA